MYGLVAELSIYVKLVFLCKHHHWLDFRSLNDPITWLCGEGNGQERSATTNGQGEQNEAGSVGQAQLTAPICGDKVDQKPSWGLKWVGCWVC